MQRQRNAKAEVVSADGGEKATRSIQTKIKMYLDSTKVGKVEGAAEKFIQTQALRRDFPLGGFGS